MIFRKVLTSARTQKTFVTAISAAMIASMVVAAGGCGPKPRGAKSTLHSDSAPSSEPATEVKGQRQNRAKRWLNDGTPQTAFLNMQRTSYGSRRSMDKGGLESMLPEAAPGAANGVARRDIVESDVFNVDGDKLYLLNHKRGLQVVSFADGADKARRVSRKKATGAYSNDMYRIGNKVYVVERDLQQVSEYQSEIRKGRIAVYDVTNENRPIFDGFVPFDGEPTNSRLAGNILYVVSSIWNYDGYYQSGGEQKGEGHVYSFDLTKSALDELLIADYKLDKPTSANKNLNIVETEVAPGKFRYHLISVSGRNWWGEWRQDQKTAIEVVDVTSSAGNVVPVMQVDVDGIVQEKSQTTIKDGYLVAISNYREGTEQENKARLQFSTFKLPPTNKKELKQLLTTREELTQLQNAIVYLEQRFAESGNAQGALQDEISEAKARYDDLQKHGFIAIGEGKNATLFKVGPSARIEKGDDDGQHVSLRDVRFTNNRAYVFWVPQNLIDPFDQFDITRMDAPQHLSRFKFEGWIDRAIPMTYQGKDVVMGLGWKRVEEKHGEHTYQVQYPYLALFNPNLRDELTGDVLPTAYIVADKTFLGNAVYADFNAEDKFIDIRMTGENKGVIMFTGSFYNKKNQTWSEGAKLLGFDLNQLRGGGKDQVFTEGGLIRNRAGYLRRAFLNKGIDKINTFSDRELGTFDVDYRRDIGNAETVFTALNPLELARNIAAYFVHTPSDGGKAVGVQVVSDDYYMGANEGKAKTELRLVDPRAADSEQVLRTVELDGSYLKHAYVQLGARNQLVVVTQNVVRSKQPGEFFYNHTYVPRVHILKADLSVERSITLKDEILGWWNNAGLVDLKNGSVILANGTQVQLIKLTGDDAGTTTTQTIFSQNYDTATAEGACDLLDEEAKPFFKPYTDANRNEFHTYFNIDHLQVNDGVIYLAYHWTLPDDNKDLKNLIYQKHFLTRVHLAGDGAIRCDKPVNIPGELANVISDKHILTNDSKVVALRTVERKIDKKKKTLDAETVIEDLLSSVVIDWDGHKAAALADLHPRFSYQLVGKELLALQEQNDDVDFFPDFGGGRGIRPAVWHPRQPKRFAGGKMTLTRLGFNGKAQFVEHEGKFLDVVLSGSAPRLVYLAKQPSGRTIALVGSGKTYQAFSWASDEAPAAALEVHPLDEESAKLAKQATIELYTYYWSWGGRSQFSFDEATQSFSVAAGEFGVSQFYLAK